jgi:hypothetical protein
MIGFVQSKQSCYIDLTDFIFRAIIFERGADPE